VLFRTGTSSGQELFRTANVQDRGCGNKCALWSEEKGRADLASGRQLVDISNEVHDKGGSRPLQDLLWGTHLLNAPPAA